MKFSNIGISGIDLVFMSNIEREVLYRKLHILNPRDVQTLLATMALNKRAIENMQLPKDINSPIFSKTTAMMESYKSRFFKSTPTVGKPSAKSTIAEDSSNTTSEFISALDTSDWEDMFETIADEIMVEANPLEELETFIMSEGKSSLIKTGTDPRVLENNFLNIKSLYDSIPLDTAPLKERYGITNESVLNTIRALSSRLTLCDIITQQIRQESYPLVDVTVYGRMSSPSRRISIFKRFSMRRRTREETKYTLTQLSRQWVDKDTSALMVTETDDDFNMQLREVFPKTPKGEAMYQERLNDRETLQLVELYKILKGVQILESMEIFGVTNPRKEDVLECSRILAINFGITGLLPTQADTLAQSVQILNIKSRKPKVSEETLFVMKLLAMSALAEKYDMVRGEAYK